MMAHFKERERERERERELQEQSLILFYRPSNLCSLFLMQWKCFITIIKFLDAYKSTMSNG